MKSRKGFALIISLVLVIGIVLPGTLALSTDQAATNGELTVTEETPTPTPEVTETPTPTEEPEPTETPVPSETEKPAETEARKECTCSAAEGEAHKEGCPLYAAPELDIAELYSRLMAMQTQEEIVLVFMKLSPETIAEFTDEQAAAIEAHYDSLSTTAAVSGDTMTPGDETVVGSSEVRYLTYDFTDAAPFMDPVEGGN